jgi:site-specific recombinase XerD
VSTARDIHAAPAFLSLLTLFAENKAWTDSARYHVDYISRMHFEWLTEKGVFDVSHVTHAMLRAYLCHCSERLSGWGMRDCMFSLKKAYRYLFDEGYTIDSFEGIFSFSVSVARKVKPALPEDEASAIFQSIDRTSALGKRNYALLLLAYVTGLRASDIAQLTLGDIDWKIGEIHIVQKKTGHPLALPLTEDVGSALKDYILNGRPGGTSQNVFLYTKAPHYALRAQGGVRAVYESVRAKAGLTREAFDGKSFHAFRRTVGKNLLIAGTPLTDIAQILGQTNIESTKEYIPLCSERMKSCALGFGGIGPPPKAATVAHSHCALDFRGIDPASCKEKIPCCALNFRGVEWKGGAQW